MTHLVDDPKEFAADSLAGMVAAYPHYVQNVHGGVVRATASPDGEVAIVVGGGTGHYPAFAGWVGQGMAHGSVCGNVFASPSASQVISVVKNSSNGGGVVLMFGNYAGDCLHFGRAASELNKSGIATEIVAITDDIASNGPDAHEGRRGIAGDLLVVKVAGAAAAEGLPLADVVGLARRANSRTRSLGVAFSGCTLPGADRELFTVPKGEFALGLGIHGEPGLSLHPLASASDIARLLVEQIMAEEPNVKYDYQRRVAVIVNGLGATKYEELFLLFGHVKRLLEDRGIELVAPVVGEQVTSLDMAGVSLSVMFLDPDLERLWLAGADTPAFRRGAVIEASERRRLVAEISSEVLPPSSVQSRAQAGELVEYFQTLAEVAVAEEGKLGKLDSIAGDGDHGLGMVLGTTAALEAARRAQAAGAGARSLVAHAGNAWAEGAGGTSGGYWGMALNAMAENLSDKIAVSETALGYAVAKGVAAFASPGGAVIGDKTMVDATEPFREALTEKLAEGTALADSLQFAAARASEAAEATAGMIAKRGRARTHGEASKGHPDPGAVSFALLMGAIADRASK